MGERGRYPKIVLQLLIFNVIVILAGAELLMHNLVSLRTFAVVVLALFVVNLLFVWRAFRNPV
jgi:hypothetical protein